MFTSTKVKLRKMVEKYGDAHGYKGVGYKDWSKEWLEYVRTYVVRHCPGIEEWRIMSIAGNLEQVVIHNKDKFKEPFEYEKISRRKKKRQ